MMFKKTSGLSASNPAFKSKPFGNILELNEEDLEELAAASSEWSTFNFDDYQNNELSGILKKKTPPPIWEFYKDGRIVGLS